eukprot:s647_g9.t1
MSLIYKPRKPSHRLCPACLTETHDLMALCYYTCSGKLISHGWRRKKTIQTGGENSPEDDLDQDDVRDHVKEAWEDVKEEEDLDEELPEETSELGKGDDDVNMADVTEDPDASNACFQERERHDVDEYLEEQKAESEQAKGATSGVRDAQEFPAWMRRVEFGSKVLPEEPCIAGDAQSELIHIVILMLANNLCLFLARHYSLFCEVVGKLASAHAEKPGERIDIDPKIPLLGEEQNSELIEPADQQLEEHYQVFGNPTHSKHDQGMDGFVRSYHGSLIFKRLANYILECGYTADEFKAHFSLGEAKRRNFAGETADQEEASYRMATTHLVEQSRFMRRFIAGAYDATVVYFFRNQQFINTVYLNPVDLLCACRSETRRLFVIHMCLQNGNGMMVPRVLQQRLFNAIQEWKQRKKRDMQRPQWATHSSQAHILAIADTPVPPEFKKTARRSGGEAGDTTEAAPTL